MNNTRIEWTEKTWNPITGCTKISPGCAHCYAETMTRRLCAMGVRKYRNGFTPTTHSETLEEPLGWKEPADIFVCSMSDVFHRDVPDSFIGKILDVIRKTPHHNYQILTKRAERMAGFFAKHTPPSNVWLGVTVENQTAKKRIDILRGIPANIHFLSCEPLLEDLGNLNLSGIEWVIVGGESGPSARPMKEEWVISIQRQAKTQDSAFFFKQWGTWGSDGVKRAKHENGKLLKGRIFQDKPLGKAV